jgi:tripeptidyl-peptidase-1
VSYGDNENTVDFDYAQRVNVEFQKAGVRGISILTASGDGGVAGSQSGPCSKFIPTFPAASPWVTAVGGTQASAPETAAGFSGGGFSNYFARPAYQNASVANYFQVATNLPNPNDYNHTGAGFPDVSAQSVNFLIFLDGGETPVEGTSCASPTFAAVVALLNDIRFSQGKTSLGYLNPLFYGNPQVFNDITTGNNPGCGTKGFYAAPGWDPVTGLGTPDFSKLSQLVSQLP